MNPDEESTAKPTEAIRWHRWGRKEWRELATFFAWIAGITGIPCVALSLYMSTPAVIVGWISVMLGFVVLLCLLTILYALTVWPLLLLIAAIFGRMGPTVDPKSPGITVCW
jgi:hypothetical protein